ncbi:MAG: flagellar basal body P-ring formation chaperone FlgA [Armatimonadetes bacterium]|nr:flagellar basal body P-ring formation chaperone FlgA [Armatimonadota bacterium]
MKNSVFNTTLLALAIALSIEANAATAKITFKAEAQVKPGVSVMLSDIAAIQAPKDIAGKIGQIVVAQAPLAGYSRSLDANYIKQKICYSSPKSTVVSTSGANTILISGMCTKVTANELLETAKQFATEHLPKDSRTYEVSVDQISRDIIAPAGVEVKVEPELLSSELHPGLNPVKLVVKADGRSISTTYASVRVKVTAIVLVASDVIERGSSLSSQNTAWDTRDVSKIPDAITNNGSDDYQTLVAKKTVRPGSIISTGDAELPTAVKMGDSIIIMVKSKNVVLTITGEAKQSGKIGDTIRVLTPISSADVRAKITEPGMAEIKS